LSCKLGTCFLGTLVGVLRSSSEAFAKELRPVPVYLD
jgi:hypothetical protein